MALLVTIFMKGVPILLLVYIIIKILSLFRRRWELQALYRAFPGPKPTFLGGNSAELTGDYRGMVKLAEYSVQYRGAFPVWMGPFDAFLMATHPDTAKYILSGSDPKDEMSYSLMRPWIGDGLLLSGGRKWDRNRRLLTPAFHVEILKNYVKIFTASIHILSQKWSAVVEPVEVFHHISLLTLDSMLKCLFGYESNCQTETNRHPYIQGVYEVSDLIVKRIMNPLHHIDWIYYCSDNGRKFKRACNIIHLYSEQIIGSRRQLLQSEKPNSRNVDFLDILLTAKDSEGKGLTNDEIRDEVDTFMFEGHDSTASAISWCLYNLAKHPEHQDRCREEILSVIGNKRDPEWDDLGKMEYTYMCLQESMRLYPPVPNISRLTEKPIALPEGRQIPKGVRVGVSIFALQRHSDIWVNPDEYDPSRFSKDVTRSSIYYMPFSIGPRNCIGQQFALTQIRIVVAMILRRFHLSLDPDRQAEPESALILRSKNGIYLKIQAMSDD